MSGITQKANYFSKGHCLQHTCRNDSQVTRNEPEDLPFHLAKIFSRFTHQIESYEALKLPGRYYPNLPYLFLWRSRHDYLLLLRLIQGVAQLTLGHLEQLGRYEDEPIVAKSDGHPGAKAWDQLQQRAGNNVQKKKLAESVPFLSSNFSWSYTFPRMNVSSSVFINLPKGFHDASELKGHRPTVQGAPVQFN